MWTWKHGPQSLVSLSDPKRVCYTALCSWASSLLSVTRSDFIDGLGCLRQQDMTFQLSTTWTKLLTLSLAVTYWHTPPNLSLQSYFWLTLQSHQLPVALFHAPSSDCLREKDGLPPHSLYICLLFLLFLRYLPSLDYLSIALYLN